MKKTKRKQESGYKNGIWQNQTEKIQETKKPIYIFKSYIQGLKIKDEN